ncbi:MAG: hypothetical protein VKI81_09065 [Synechococcaceae cyanobacterium]|nr:hypothetical protein [Synechococcaceae cyanobacterium]
MSGFRCLPPAPPGRREALHTLGAALALLLAGAALSPGLPVRASLRVDLDAATVVWSNDDDPRALGVRQGEERILASSPLLARPLGARGRLRLAPCLALGGGLGLPTAAEGQEEAPCDGAPAPPGAAGLRLEGPLPADWREGLLKLWEEGERPVPPEAEALREAMAAAALRLRSGLRYDEAGRLLRPLGEALAAAETLVGTGAAAIEPELLARARRAEGMGRALQDLWRRRIALTSRDMSLPCDLLERHERAFNRAAGSGRVRLRAERPRGICLFCGNVCTAASADRLLADMKEALREELSPTP